MAIRNNHRDRVQSTKIIIDANQSKLSFKIRELYEYWELLAFLTWRQIIIHYKQTVIGILWVIIQPLFSALVLTLVFSIFLKVDSGAIPYPVFVLTAWIPWKYFSEAVTRSGQSLVHNSQLVNKIYFPRLIIPISSSLSPLVDFAVSFLILLIFMFLSHIVITWRILFVPFLILYALLTSLSVSLFLAALNVRYRDINYAIPFLIQIWMYLTPVMYSIDTVPLAIRVFYRLNPMVGVIEGTRWALLGVGQPDFLSIAISGFEVIVLLILGIFYFNRVERSFADVI